MARKLTSYRLQRPRRLRCHAGLIVRGLQAVTLLAALFLVVAGVEAQGTGDDTGDGTGSADGTAAAASDPAAPGVVREQRFYVPFERLSDVFQKEGRGFFLSYQQFTELWNRAHEKLEAKAKASRPATIDGGVYRGRVFQDRAVLSVRLTVTTSDPSWQAVDLPFQGVAIESVTFEEGSVEKDRPVLVVHPGGGYRLWVPRAGTYPVDLLFTVPLAQEPGKKTFGFGFPGLVSSRLELLIPEPDAQIEVAGGLASEMTRGPDRVDLRVFLGASSLVRVSWAPPAGRAVEAGAVLVAEQTIGTHLRERVLEQKVRVDYRVERGEVREFRVDLPPDTQLISVKGENIREWAPETTPGEAGQPPLLQLRVTLHSPVKDKYQLEFTTERLLSAVPEQLVLPFPRVRNVLRETGWLMLTYDEGLKLRPVTTESLSQLDRDELPDGLRSQRALGYRYLAQPIRWEGVVETITPRVEARTLSAVVLGKQEDLWVGEVRYTIRRAGVFSLEFQIPRGWTLLEVGDPNGVEDHRIENSEDVQRVIVDLKTRAIGEFVLPFRATRSGSAQIAAGASEALTLGPPVVANVARAQGVFGVSVPGHLEVVTVTRQALVDAEAGELQSLRGRLPGGATAPRTFRYRTQPASAALRLTGKQAGLEAVAQHLVEVTDAELRFTHWLDYNVLYASVDRLSFVAPTLLDDRLQIETEQKTEIERMALPDGLTRWEIRLQPPAIGPVTVRVTHSMPLSGMVAGEEKSHDAPLIRPIGTQSEVGFIAVRKEGSLEIDLRGGGWEPLDATSLPDRLRRGKIYRSLRYFGGDPKLALDLTRYDYEPLAQTTVPLLHLKSLLSRERRLKTRATLFVKNAGRQFLELKLPKDARVYSLTVAGERQAPKRRADGVSLVDIPPSLDADGVFPVVVVYEIALPGADSESSEEALSSWGGLRVEAPQLGDDIPVGRIEMDLFLPPEYRYYGWDGSLDPHTDGSRQSWWQQFKVLLADGRVPVTAGRDEVFNAAPQVDLELPTRGYRRQSLETLGAGGFVEFSYVDQRLFWVLDALVFILSLGLVLVLSRGGRLRPSLVFTVGVLLFASLAVGIWQESAVSGLAGAIVGFVAVLLRRGLMESKEIRRRKKAARVELAPDPFLEDAEAPKQSRRRVPTPKSGSDDPSSPAKDADVESAEDAVGQEETDQDESSHDDDTRKIERDGGGEKPNA